MTRQFWHLYFLGITYITFGFYIMGAFKQYGQTKIANDELLTYMGSVGSFMNGIARVVYGSLLDNYSFKTVFGFLTILQLALVLTI